MENKEIIIGKHIYREVTKNKWIPTDICVDEDNCDLHNQPERLSEKTSKEDAIV